MKKTLIKTETIQFRIDPKLKIEAVKVFKRSNIDLSLALQTFLSDVVKRGISPMQIRTENGFFPEYEKSLLKSFKNAKLSKSFSNSDEFIESLIK